MCRLEEGEFSPRSTEWLHKTSNMSIKDHFVDSHLAKFPDNCGDFSDEQGERFHQDLKTRLENYRGPLPGAIGQEDDGELLLEY